jgi:hypothetical protein
MEGVEEMSTDVIGSAVRSCGKMHGKVCYADKKWRALHAETSGAVMH